MVGQAHSPSYVGDWGGSIKEPRSWSPAWAALRLPSQKHKGGGEKERGTYLAILVLSPILGRTQFFYYGVWAGCWLFPGVLFGWGRFPSIAFILKRYWGPGGMAQLFRALAVHSEDMGLTPSTHIRWLINACNPALWDLSLLWTLWAPALPCAHPHMCTCVHTHNLKIK